MEAAVLPALDGITNKDLLKWMFRFLAPVKPLVFRACMWLVLWVGTEVLSTNQARNVVNEIQALPASGGLGHLSFGVWVRSASARPLLHQVGILALLIVVMSVLRYVRETSNTRLSMTLVFYLREAIYDKLQRVGFAFHDVLSSGQLINRALSDLQNVRTFIQTAVLTTLEIALVVGGYMILLAMLNWRIAALSLLPLPVWIWYIVRFSRQVQPASKAVMEAQDRNVSLLAENIAGVHVVKAFATEKQEVSKYNSNCDSFFELTRKRIVMYANFTPIIRAIASASLLSLCLLGGILIIRGNIKVGDFLILGAAMNAILARLQLVGTISDQYQNAIVSSRRLYEVLQAPATIVERPTAGALPAGPGEIVFDHVTFGYDPVKPVLRDVSFRIKGGTIVAVVGPTGAGKTTLVSLINRFYDPQQGRILIDGTDIRECSLESLRTQTSMVFQETYLFSDTVTGNIRYGKPQITEGEVEAAARLAQAHEFIETLPKGYSTMLGERGASLSGGQRQRLAIARAICINPRILILDDATAAVDPETEDLIRKAMRFVMSGRTTFVIAHRLSTAKRADVVIVLENGRITGMGTHNELMARNAHYREIARVQLYADDEDAPLPPLVSDAESSHMNRMLNAPQVAASTAEAKEKLERETPVGEA
jgi:ATP-binding cassette subfamily B protein